MPTVGATTGNASLASERACSPHTTLVQLTRMVMQRAQDLWPRARRKELARRAEVSVRAVDHWQAGTRTLSADVIARLLRSEDGLHFLAAIMGDARPRWWRAFHEHLVIADARRLQSAAKRRLQEALNADADLAAAIARAESYADEDFHKPHLDALQSVARLLDRPVAAATKKQRR